MKECPRCREPKPLDQFARDASKASGHKSHCKACDNRKSLAYYEANREQVRERRRAYSATRPYVPAEPKTLTCQWCSSEFQSHMPWAKYCARKCYEAKRRQDPKRKAYHRHVMNKRRVVKADTDLTGDTIASMVMSATSCPLCGTRLSREHGDPRYPHVDHIVPLGAGGTHTLGNVRVICADCNLRRPKDGSDYTGPLTLWSMVPGVITKPEVKPGPKPVKIKRQSARDRRMAALRATAIALRGQGMKWEDVAQVLGYQSSGSVYASLVIGHEDKFPKVEPRLKPWCKYGHEFTVENTRIGSDGKRECWTCRREARRRKKAIAKARERELRRERGLIACELRKRGFDFTVIADKCGYKSKAAAASAIAYYTPPGGG